MENSLLSAVSINKKFGKMLAVRNSWLKGCRIDYFLLPRRWENCSLYSVITSHMSADHSFSAVNWYSWSKSKKKSSYEISFLSNNKMYINSPVYLSEIYSGIPFPWKIRPLISAVCGKSSHYRCVLIGKKIRLMMWPWHDTATHIHSPISSSCDDSQ